MNSNDRPIKNWITLTIEMAVVLFFFVSAIAPSTTWANSKLINVQGKLTNSSGSPLTGTYIVTFRLYKNTTDAISGAVWTESQSVTSPDGLFNVTLGKVSAMDAIVFTIPYYLGIQVAGDA